MARLKIQNMWGSKYEITLKTNTYANNDNLYIGMTCWDDEGYPEPYGDLTVNLGIKCRPNCGYVDINNNPGIQLWIIRNNLGKPTGRIGHSGFCDYPEFEFDMEEIQKYMEV